MLCLRYKYTLILKMFCQITTVIKNNRHCAYMCTQYIYMYIYIHFTLYVSYPCNMVYSVHMIVYKVVPGTYMAYDIPHLQESETPFLHISSQARGFCMCCYILNDARNIILNTKFWIYYHGVRWKYTTYVQAISQNLHFHYMLIVAVNRLELKGRAPISAESSPWSSESSSLAVFCLALSSLSLT